MLHGDCIVRRLATKLVLCGALVALAAVPAHAEERDGILLIDDTKWDGDPYGACMSTNAAIVEGFGYRRWCAKDAITRAAAEACRQGAIDAAIVLDIDADIDCDAILVMTFPPDPEAASEHLLLELLGELRQQTMYLKHLCAEALGGSAACKDQ